MNVTDVRRKTISLLLNTVRERALAKDHSCNLGDMQCTCVCRRTKLPGRGVRYEKLRETGSKPNQRSCDR